MTALLLHETAASLDSSVVFSDCLLSAPVLSYPDNRETFRFDTTEVSLRWEGVSGADFYVVQISLSSDFRGPLVWGYRIEAPISSESSSSGSSNVNALEKVLTLGENLFTGMTMYWRVFSYAEAACSSPPSETWSFSINVPPPYNSSGDSENCAGEIIDVDVEQRVAAGDTVRATSDWSSSEANNLTGYWEYEGLDNIGGAVMITTLRGSDEFIEFEISELATSGTFTLKFCLEGHESSANDVCCSKDITVMAEDRFSSSSDSSSSGQDSSTSGGFSSSSSQGLSDLSSSSSQGESSSSQGESSSEGFSSGGNLNECIDFAVIDSYDSAEDCYQVSSRTICFVDGLATDLSQA